MPIVYLQLQKITCMLKEAWGDLGKTDLLQEWAEVESFVHLSKAVDRVFKVEKVMREHKKAIDKGSSVLKPSEEFQSTYDKIAHKDDDKSWLHCMKDCRAVYSAKYDEEDR